MLSILSSFNIKLQAIFCGLVLGVHETVKLLKAESKEPYNDGAVFLTKYNAIPSMC